MAPDSARHVALIFNAPVLEPTHPDFASEAGVLDSVAAIRNALRAAKYRVTELSIGRSIAEFIDRLAILRPDVGVNLCEGFAGCAAGEAHVAGVFELLDLPYTGSPAAALTIALDKVRTKRLLAGGGVMTPEFLEVPQGSATCANQLSGLLNQGPVIVKPGGEDASLGIGQDSVTSDSEHALRQIEKIHKLYGDALVERYIAGREFNIGIIELPQLEVLPIAEIAFQTDPTLRWPIVTYEGKWQADSAECVSTPVQCPTAVDDASAEKIRRAAMAAYRIVGCRDYARVDLRVDSLGQVYVLEVNANPDAGPEAGLARMLRAAGIEYSDFCQRLVEAAACRAEGERGKAESRITQPNSLLDPLAAGREPNEPAKLAIRLLQLDDRAAILELTRACGVFRPDEMDVADEVLREAIRDGAAGHYQVLVADSDDKPIGWSCHGKVPMTDATFDLYWIAVAPNRQGQGIGRQLLAEIEFRLRSTGARWLLAETSSTGAYQATRNFYLRGGFQVVSDVPDFYRTGDGRVTFGKRLDK